MTYPTLKDFAGFLAKITPRDLDREIETPKHLSIVASGPITMAYAPFDHVNVGAKLVIVGITPGRQQMRNALMEARRCLISGKSIEDASAAAKVHASFSGTMRSNLVAMLDQIGVNHALDLDTTGALWSERSDLAHFTSVVRYPTFVNGKNYSGNPPIQKTPILMNCANECLAEELRACPDALIVPLGPKVAEVIRMVAQAAGLDAHRVLDGLPHPSGANAERISYFLGRKSAACLSNKTNANLMDRCRENLMIRINQCRLQSA